MGLFNWGKPKPNTTPRETWVEVDKSGHFYHYISKMLAGGQFERFDPCRSFHFATHVAEIFTPIDLIAERVASCSYDIYNKNTGEIVENIPDRLQKLINRPNPMHSGTELIYQIQFSELASGGSYTLTKMPSSYKAKAYDRITNIWCLNPDLTAAKIKAQIPDPFMVQDIGELIEKYLTHWLVDMKLDPSEVYYNTVTKVADDLNTVSPLEAVRRNIDNLLAVYSARFNVYEKNGVSGIVYKDNKGATGVSEQVNPVTRQAVLDDIQNRDGITRDRNFVGISSFPLGFIDTLGKIKDLEPWKETAADAMAIAGIFNVDKELIPKEGSSTFTNKKDTEKHLWQNTINPYADEMAKTLTNIYYLPEEWEFRANTENIEILQADRKTTQEADKLEIENLEKLKTLGVDISENLEKWNNKSNN